MKLTEGRKAMIARHVQEVENAVDAHKIRMASMMERQRLELIELMLVEDARQKPHDLIALMKAEMYSLMEGESPCSADYSDCQSLIRMLDRTAEKFPTVD